MQVLMTPSRVVWGRRGTEGLAGGWWVLGKARDLCCLSYRNFPLSLFPSFPLSLFPSFPLSLFPSFPLSLFPSFPLSLFPSFPLSLFPSFPLSLFPSFPLSLSFPEYLCHVYVRSDGLAGVVIADNEYPQRVCFTLLDKVLDEFSRQVSKMDWPSGSPATISYSALDGYLSKYQNPRDADPMTRVQAELDETKIILHNTMESLLERGEKLDDLVSKSEVLGAQSKAFYKTVGVEGHPF
uniref:YKT6 v-SNARE homolog n=1 Tax=Ficedula albicollis TaxID=59894 RepID=A0A803VNI3_FICAL